MEHDSDLFKRLSGQLGEWELSSDTALTESPELRDSERELEVEIVALVEVLNAARFRYGEQLTERLSRLMAGQHPELAFLRMGIDPETGRHVIESCRDDDGKEIPVEFGPISSEIDELLSKLAPILGADYAVLHVRTRYWHFLEEDEIATIS